MTETTESKPVSSLDKFFHITEKGSSVGTEIRGGIITFLAMSYILAVNPLIITTGAFSEISWGAVFIGTALAAVISCLLMGLYAKFPVALAPGMGINAFLAYTIAGQLGGSYAICMAVVFVSGVLFLLVSVSHFREKIIDSIPMGMRYAIAAGIGFFIALIGLTNAGIIVNTGSPMQFSVDLLSPAVLLGLFCVFLTLILWIKKMYSAVIVGMVVTLILGLILGYVFPDDTTGLLPALPSAVLTDFGAENYFGLFVDGFGQLSASDIPVFIASVVSLFIVDMFDTAGTLIGVASRADMMDENGNIENVRKAMIVDSVGTVIGAAVGTTTTTSYIESATGVEAGARTGLSTVVVGLLFLLALFFSPVLGMFTSACTVGALVLVGVLMISSVKEIDWKDPVFIVTAFFTIFIMGLSGSITNGIAFGIFGYVIAMAFSGKAKEISGFVWILAVIFLAYYIIYYGFI